MKTSLLSFVAALTLLTATSSYAAPAASDPYKSRKAAIKYDRKVELARARREAAQRKLELERQRKLAAERARLEAQRHHNIHGHNYGYRH
ncbi:hypothetical protein [Hymenobacter cavernae]|uniref:Uncharacterized protein n=1 Tax=Hymenobacter cavernae TaxID=2044852 RepID=A0ABQ1UHC6_9BACT|nr:hypothetical protein [Hymenobacter cavernae]GGF18078.1 hypothetical protein GCM10011383_31930 [Hymenobacter cavernae]